MSAPIRSILIYGGDKEHSNLGPYAFNAKKKEALFRDLAAFREIQGKDSWEILTFSGKNLVGELERRNPRVTLLVVPAGPSSNFDKSFSAEQLAFLRERFFNCGGRGWFTCGSAYWVSRVRCYSGAESKNSLFPLFEGAAEGPLCPFPGNRYKTDFYSDAVKVTDGKSCCRLYLSGGGSFIPDKESSQKVRVLARYSPKELRRLNIEEPALKKRENAAVMVSVGEGAALLEMFHPEYKAQDFDVERCKKAFPDCGTDWERVRSKIGSLADRVNFCLALLQPLEEMDFSEPRCL